MGLAHRVEISVDCVPGGRCHGAIAQYLQLRLTGRGRRDLTPGEYTQLKSTLNEIGAFFQECPPDVVLTFRDKYTAHDFITALRDRDIASCWSEPEEPGRGGLDNRVSADFDALTRFIDKNFDQHVMDAASARRRGGRG